MPDLIESLLGIDSQVTQACEFCSNVKEYRGWTGLCNRGCYYGLCDLIELYENGKVATPDQRVVVYFTKYPNTSHTFMNEKTLSYVTRVSEPS